ncbi:hypothetical protein ACFX2C_023291 [Malus domestica]
MLGWGSKDLYYHEEAAPYEEQQPYRDKQKVMSELDGVMNSTTRATTAAGRMLQLDDFEGCLCHGWWNA